uniref:photosystem II protein L n=1 Tax=Wisteriopsis japonica TaxID=53902 RepID=UPI001FAF3DCD|nr:photosystem II protein L [Wisteriopsis japonica]UJT96935.1 photosystem II protein L [Wisteriopsis japonica]
MVPVSTGGYYSFLYLLFYFQIISSINRRKANSIYIRNSLIPIGRISFHNYL